MKRCYVPPAEPTPAEIAAHRAQQRAEFIIPLVLLAVFAACGLAISIVTKGATP